MTSIQWTEETWNPVTGCTKVSAGCKNCYAEGIADRFFAKQYPPNGDGSPRKFTDVRMHPERLDDPLRRKKPTMYFVNSMSDLFHEDVSFEFILAVLARCVTASQHTFQILTKRPQRVLDFNRWMKSAEYRVAWRSNIWIGVSVENQRFADERIPLLLATPAAVRFLSVEPLLEQVNIQKYTHALDWVICGGESGSLARPFNLGWADALRIQCESADVPFFMKQVGTNPRTAAGMPFHTRDAKGGEPAEWPERLRIRDWPKARLAV